MGGAALEVEPDHIVGHRAHGHGGVHVHGVPGKGGVQPRKAAGLGHESLAKAGLLGRAAEKFYRAGRAGGLEPFFQDQRRAHRPGAQGAVTAAMTAFLARDGPGLGHAGLLAEVRQGVVLAQNADDRGALAPGCLERGGQAARAGLDRKALAAQHLRDQGAALGFAVAEFGALPHPAVDLRDEGRFFGGCLPDEL